MLFWILFFISFWLCIDIPADIIFIFNDKLVKKNWFNLWYLHVLSIVCGWVYMFGVLLFLMDEVLYQAIQTKQEKLDEFKKSLQKNG